MVEITSIIVLAIINFAMVLYLRYITDKYNGMLKDCLNRIMANNYQAYVHGEVALKQEPETDYEEYDRGIPV